MFCSVLLLTGVFHCERGSSAWANHCGWLSASAVLPG
jgi:hypothetical protein